MRKRSVHRPSSGNQQTKTCLCMGLRIFQFCFLVALRTNIGVALAGIPLHYNVLPHVQYSQPLGPLTAPALKAPMFVQEPSPLPFTYTAEPKRGFSSKSGSRSTAGEVAGSYSFNMPDGRQQKVNYKAGRSDERGIHAGENPTNVQVLALGLDAPRLSETKHVGPEVLSGEPRKSLFYTYSAGAKTTNVSGNLAGSYSVEYTAGSDRLKPHIRSNKPGVVSGKIPTNVNINHFSAGVVPYSYPANVNNNHFPGVPAIPIGAYGTEGGYTPVKSMNPFFFTYTADVEGGFSSRTEGGDGSGNVAGTYSVAHSDGRRRTVKYIAGADGFMADIQSNEPGVEPHSNPANVKISSFSGAPVIPAGSFTGAGAAVIPAGFSTGAGTAVLAAESSPFNFTYTADANENSISRSGNGDIARKTVGSYPVTHADGIKRAVDYSIGTKSFRPSIQSNGKEIGDNLAHASNSTFTGVIGSARAVIPISTAASPQSFFVSHPPATTGFFETTRYAPASESKVPNYSWYR
ncbi:uncharacterized protein LOC143229293 [Tachypleus tridentatus]|uniref:uncharacterized protein LOC143229293 n=1 Tax=Tachypleus tridentatus TaxID=6853 RepID=UPI003FD1478C